MCRNTKMPAVLMEYGFMDSPDDVPVILTEEHAKLCGYATIDAIAKKAGLKLRQSPASEPVGGVRYKGIADAPEYARHAIGERKGHRSGSGRPAGSDHRHAIREIPPQPGTGTGGVGRIEKGPQSEDCGLFVHLDIIFRRQYNQGRNTIGR